jgi:hypothetical protein
MQMLNDQARHIVTHPRNYASQPSVLAINWEKLKNARGQTVNHDRIGGPAYLIVDTDRASAQIIRIRTKVRDYAQTRGYDLPPSAA